MYYYSISPTYFRQWNHCNQYRCRKFKNKDSQFQNAGEVQNTGKCFELVVGNTPLDVFDFS